MHYWVLGRWRNLRNRFAEMRIYGSRSAVRELAIIVAASVVILVFAQATDAFEAIAGWATAYERFEVDELITVAIFLAFAVSVFCVRRMGELHRAVREALAAKLAAEEANQAKSRFLAVMSHEFRTPLNAILGFSQIIRDQALGDQAMGKYVEYGGDIHASGRRLLGLVEDILDLAKFEAGKIELRRQPLDIVLALSDCVEMVASEARAKNITLLFDPPEARPVIVADPRCVEHMVANLLSNAVKFTPAGGRVELTTAARGAEALEIAVSDTGVGIAPEDLERIRRPFEQAKRNAWYTGLGTGLGLALVDQLALLHGGSLELESAPGIGTVAQLVLPTAEPGRLSAPRAEAGGAPTIRIDRRVA